MYLINKHEDAVEHRYLEFEYVASMDIDGKCGLFG